MNAVIGESSPSKRAKKLRLTEVGVDPLLFSVNEDRLYQQGSCTASTDHSHDTSGDDQLQIYRAHLAETEKRTEHGI